MKGINLHAVQAGLYDRLVSDSVLQQMITGVYDTVPEQSDLPYIVLTDSVTLDKSNMREHMALVTSRVQIFSESEGQKEVQDIAARVTELLDGEAIAMVSGGTVDEVLVSGIAITRLTDLSGYRADISLEMRITLI